MQALPASLALAAMAAARTLAARASAAHALCGTSGCLGSRAMPPPSRREHRPAGRVTQWMWEHVQSCGVQAASQSQVRAAALNHLRDCTHVCHVTAGPWEAASAPQAQLGEQLLPSVVVRLR